MKKIKENIYEIELIDIQSLFKEREIDSHKGMFGTVGIMGGSLEYSGAVKLANMSASAVRSGAGIVRVIVPENIASAILPYLLEQTLYPLKCDNKGHIYFDMDDLERALKNLKSLAIGMGWGISEEYKKILDIIIKKFNGKLLIDADGLNTLAQMDLNILKETNSQIILTPHLKEFQRLSKIDIEKIKQNSIEIATNFAKEYNVILLLKGSTTIVTDGKNIYLIKKGVPGMATAGSGDVLSGIILSLIGQGLSPFDAACAGAWIHGKSGDICAEKFGEYSMTPSDMLDNISKVMLDIVGC